ncbi:MAG: hypothetical protein CMK38_06970 [Porticoccaceae bacterium]|nr:hypothetical protein [Porticoccaceae bacterium]
MLSRFLSLFQKKVEDKPPVVEEDVCIELEHQNERYCFHDTSYNGITTAQEVFDEIIKDCYRLDSIAFQPGDKVIDIGGHVGVFSVYLAKKHPEIEIFIYEPVPKNIVNIRKNLEKNGVKNVTVFEKGVAQVSNQKIKFIKPVDQNTGGGTAQTNMIDSQSPSDLQRVIEIETISLEDIFETNQIEKCRLLKIDCEGAEHEILMNTNKLPAIEHIRGEFHINQRLKSEGYSISKLEKHLRKYIPKKNLFYTPCNMCD